jgi:hypothetical protein
MQRLLSKSEHSRPPLVAQGSVTSEAQGLRLELRVWQEGRPFRRTVRAVSCGELQDAAALILALLMDPGLHVSSGDPHSAPSPPATPPRRDNSRTNSTTHWGAFSGGGVDSGTLPKLAPGLTLGAFAKLGELGVRLGAVWLPISKEQVDDASASPEGGKFSLLTGNARLCYRFLASVGLGACATGELGVLRGAGFGTQEDRTRNLLWGALGGGAELELPLASAASLVFTADALFAVNRPTFELENVGALYRPNLLSLRSTLVVLLYFQ